MIRTRTSFGIASALNLDIVREIAPYLEQAGFVTLWVNDTPDGDALESLAVAAEVTRTLRLATGVISVDRRPAAEIIATFRRLHLPEQRVTIGIGSAAPPSPLSRIASSIDTIRARLSCDVMVGALGPKMRALAVTHGDGALLNWLPPDAARQAVDDKEHALESHGGDRARMALYVRTALGKAARDRLKGEAARYEGIPSYAANFRRLGVSAMDTAVASDLPGGVREGLARYSGVVDEVVIRAVTPNDTVEEYEALIDAVRDDSAPK